MKNTKTQDIIQFIPVLDRNIGRATYNIDAHSERARFLKKLSFVRAWLGGIWILESGDFGGEACTQG